MRYFDKGFWARTAVATVVISTGVLMAMRVAFAIQGGESRPSLTFAGTLTGVTGSQTLTFTFNKGGTAVCSPTAMATPSSTGAFSVEIPLSSCPPSLFDGSDVTYNVAVGSTVLAMNQDVNPVPYARYADHVGSPNCPVSYSQDTTVTGIIDCKLPLAGGVFDEVVKVGTGATAFWVDRYEASAWQNANGSGAQYGTMGAPDYPSTFPPDGQASSLVYAFSVNGVAPSANITWFQADAACRASGKRLPYDPEWLTAARGTFDPGASSGAGGSCLTGGSAARPTGLGTACVSVWGAQDMIGNLWEWTADWYAGTFNPAATAAILPWPAGYNDGQDATFGIAGAAFDQGTSVIGIPGATCRGGEYGMGSQAGTFAMAINSAPTNIFQAGGFRCVIPR